MSFFCLPPPSFCHPQKKSNWDKVHSFCVLFIRFGFVLKKNRTTHDFHFFLWVCVFSPTFLSEKNGKIAPFFSPPIIGHIFFDQFPEKTVASRFLTCLTLTVWPLTRAKLCRRDGYHTKLGRFDRFSPFLTAGSEKFWLFTFVHKMKTRVRNKK